MTEPAMEPLRMAMFRCPPVRRIPVPVAAAAVEVIVKPFRSNETPSVAMVMASPPATVRLPVR